MLEKPRERYDALTDLERSLESFEAWFSRRYEIRYSEFTMSAAIELDKGFKALKDMIEQDMYCGAV